MDNLLKKHAELKFDHCYEELSRLIQKKRVELRRDYGIEKELSELYKKLPEITPSSINLDTDWIRVGEATDIDTNTSNKLLRLLEDVHPWRKGPFEIFGIKIDTEWLSYIKWNRLEGAISPLKGKRILDIGSSSGYYMFRMLKDDPRMVLGIEPYLRFYFQYKILQHYIQADNLFCIPAKLEEMPDFSHYFDTIFCMGILYHRKSPVESLDAISQYMKKGGELVLETLIIEGEDDVCLFPKDRYSKMRNVFFIPTLSCLSSWLNRSGFENVRCIDVSPTTSAEQRKTKWIQTESLEDFIDPDAPSKTVEGYPAPVRAVMIANAR